MCAEFVRNEEGPTSWTHRPLTSVGDADPAQIYLDRLGEGSRRTMREALSKLAGWASNGRCDAHELPWALLRIEHTAALRTRLARSLAPATANKHLAALRGVLKECWRAGQMSAENYQRAIDLPPVRGASPRKTRRLSAHDLERLAEACREDRSPAGTRDAALFALLCGAQLRRSEAVALEFEDYDPVRGQLRVQAARSEGLHSIGISDDLRSALDRWIEVRGGLPGALFNPINKGGRIEERRLSEQAIYIACQKRAAEAGLRPISPEDLRKAGSDGEAGLWAGPDAAEPDRFPDAVPGRVRPEQGETRNPPPTLPGVAFST